MWGERLDVAVYTCKDSATALKALKLAPQREKKKLSAEWLAAKVCPEDTTRSCIKIEELKVEKGIILWWKRPDVSWNLRSYRTMGK
jgi:hypothetical protein